jgi:hypothetical protein
VLRRIFGPTREEVTGGWKRLRNEELHNLYVSPNILLGCFSRKEDKIDWACSADGRNVNFINILVGKPEGKRALGRET